MELQAQNAADALTATRVGCCWQRCPSWLTRKAYLAPCRPLSSSGRDVGNSRAPSTISSPRPGDQCYIRIGRRGGVVVARGKRPSERCFASFSSPSSSSSSLSHSLTHSLTHQGVMQIAQSVAEGGETRNQKRNLIERILKWILDDRDKERRGSRERMSKLRQNHNGDFCPEARGTLVPFIGFS